MSIFVDSDTKVIYQGLTGSQGRYYGLLNREYGTQVVGGTNPKKAGEDVDGVPVFANCADAVEATGATASCIFIPAAGVYSAVMDAAAGGIKFIVCITEGVPVLDMLEVKAVLRGQGCQLVGPNCPGIITPGACKMGIMPGFIHEPGCIGIVSRSGTLTYEAVFQTTKAGLGQTTCIGIGGDPIRGVHFIDCLELFEADPATRGIILVGEIGGSDEEAAAEFIKGYVSKPVVGYIAGATAPPGKKMGHAGAIISGGKGAASDKMNILRSSGIKVCDSPAKIGLTMKTLIDNI